MSAITQISKRGQITLPAEVRKMLGLEPGDTLVVRVEEGRIVLEPAVVLPLELYSDERVAEFEENAEVSPEKLEAFKKAWGQV
ncbi:AbrB/MazE/SpoVT family DNA-binding domain-containing protein [Oceanithermus sp.]